MNRKTVITAILIMGALIGGCASVSRSQEQGIESFNEVWAYLMKGEEREYAGDEPITDLCYFSAELDYKGGLVCPPYPSSLARKKNQRLHIVLANINDVALTHFILNPDLKYRGKLIDGIRNISRKYDGVQIDLESVHPDDRARFCEFLKDVKSAIGNKVLSVAVPAYTADKSTGFDYQGIAAVADRVFIMAYDEHWSGSAPGPIASSEWCANVARYAVTKIPREKIVFGIPFYGRSWQDKRNSRAYTHKSIGKMMTGRPGLRALDPSYPSFTFDDVVRVSVYYENPGSILEKGRIYKSYGINSIGFWRLGQEDRKLWNMISAGNAVDDNQTTIVH